MIEPIEWPSRTRGTPGCCVVDHQVQRLDVVEHRVDAEAAAEAADAGALRRPAVAAEVHGADAEARGGECGAPAGRSGRSARSAPCTS